MNYDRPFCMSIAGFDPSGGAGILSDIKVFENTGTYGFGVCSSLTFQNDIEFYNMEWLNFNQIINQIKALLKFNIKSFKIGLIENIDILEKVVLFIKENYPDSFIIWDPILKSSSGFTFHNSIKIPQSVYSNVDLLTPNYVEYSAMSENFKPFKNILIKGGHKTQNRAVDELITGNTKIEITGNVLESKYDKHGTGCVLSAAIASYIALGFSIEESCIKAKKHIEIFMLSCSSKLGYHTK